jgi:23S rRNA pseudoU1915 N3-methylase RlmH
MQLLELIKAVEEKTLPKDKLEEYRDQMSVLFAKFQMELADIKKLKAIYFIEERKKTDKETERNWQATQKGLREIELSHYSKALEKMLSSLKSRIYETY